MRAEVAFEPLTALAGADQSQEVTATGSTTA